VNVKREQQEKGMTSKKSDSSGGDQPENTKQSEGMLKNAFKAGVGAAEDIHKRAFQIPLDMLEGMGAPKDKVDMLRDKSQHLIGELYNAINTVASQISPGASNQKSSTDKDE
jgi:hypothetical protein